MAVCDSILLFVHYQQFVCYFTCLFCALQAIFLWFHDLFFQKTIWDFAFFFFHPHQSVSDFVFFLEHLQEYVCNFILHSSQAICSLLHFSHAPHKPVFDLMSFFVHPQKHVCGLMSFFVHLQEPVCDLMSFFVHPQNPVCDLMSFFVHPRNWFVTSCPSLCTHRNLFMTSCPSLYTRRTLFVTSCPSLCTRSNQFLTSHSLCTSSNQFVTSPSFLYTNSHMLVTSPCHRFWAHILCIKNNPNKNKNKVNLLSSLYTPINLFVISPCLCLTNILWLHLCSGSAIYLWLDSLLFVSPANQFMSGMFKKWQGHAKNYNWLRSTSEDRLLLPVLKTLLINSSSSRALPHYWCYSYANLQCYLNVGCTDTELFPRGMDFYKHHCEMLPNNVS